VRRIGCEAAAGSRKLPWMRPEHLVESVDRTPISSCWAGRRKPFNQAALADFLSRPADDAIDRTKGAPCQEHPDQPDPTRMLRRR